MIKEFISKIQSTISSAGTVRYKSTSEVSNYIVWDFEIYNKSGKGYDGQIIIDIVYDSVSDILDKQDLIKEVLENFDYSDENITCSVYGLILNDLSSIEKDKFHHEMRLDFRLY